MTVGSYLGTGMSRSNARSSSVRTSPIQYLSSIMGYKIGRVIGEGSYCKVRTADLGRHRMAVKVISRTNASQDFVQRFLPRELSILPEISHPNIIRIYKIVDFHHEVYIFMELAEHGDLLDFIRANGPIPEGKCRQYFRQLLDAICYLHSKQISHRDLKCENVLLNGEDKVKVTDFGFCRRCVDGVSGKRVLSRTYCGSAAYAAPEVLQGMPYNPKMYDVWSLGCILFVMATGTMPFDDSNIKKMISVQMQRKLHFPSKVPISTDCKNLIKSMLEPDVTRRATPNQISQHRWLQN